MFEYYLIFVKSRMPSKVSSVRRARFILTAFSALPEFWLFGRPDTELSNGCCAHSRRHTDVRTTRPDNSPCLAHPYFPRVYVCARHRPPALGILPFVCNNGVRNCTPTPSSLPTTSAFTTSGIG